MSWPANSNSPARSLVSILRAETFPGMEAVKAWKQNRTTAIFQMEETMNGVERKVSVLGRNKLLIKLWSEDFNLLGGFDELI